MQLTPPIIILIISILVINKHRMIMRIMIKCTICNIFCINLEYLKLFFFNFLKSLQSILTVNNSEMIFDLNLKNYRTIQSPNCDSQPYFTSTVII